MKRPDQLKASDFIKGEIPAQLVASFDEIGGKNEELADGELWNTESLCFCYCNILQHYKTVK